MNYCICCLLLLLVRLSRLGTNQPGFITSEAVNIAECSFCAVRAAPDSSAYICGQHGPQCSHLSLYSIRKQSMTGHFISKWFLASLIAITTSALARFK